MALVLYVLYLIYFLYLLYGPTNSLQDPSYMPLHWYAILTALASAGAQFVLLLRWLHRRMRDDEINRAFIRDVAANHLPHIYSALRQIAAEKGIALEDPPLVRFVDLHNHSHHPRR